MRKVQAGYRLDPNLKKQIDRECRLYGTDFEEWLTSTLSRERLYRQQVRLLHAELTRLRSPR